MLLFLETNFPFGLTLMQTRRSTIAAWMTTEQCCPCCCQLGMERLRLMSTRRPPDTAP